MLRLLFTFALFLSLPLALLIGAALLIGLQQPPSPWTNLLRLNDCELPCWIGIVPGKTTLAEARRQLETVYDNPALYRFQENSDYFTVIYNATGERMSVVLDAGLGQVDQQAVVKKIHVWPDISLSPPVTLADVFGSFKDSEAVQLSSIGGIPVLVMFHRQGQVGVVIDAPLCNKVLPSQQIYIILISDQPLDNYFSWLSQASPWRGFQRCYSLEFARRP